MSMIDVKNLNKFTQLYIDSVLSENGHVGRKASEALTEHNVKNHGGRRLRSRPTHNPEILGQAAEKNISCYTPLH